MKITNHLLTPSIQRLIPGGADLPIRRFLVIHFTAGASAQSSIDYWNQLANGVCAHIVIDRDGTIYQCRPFNRTAGHAGPSKWRDPHTGKLYSGTLNKVAIGIELANGGDTYPTKFSTLKPTWSRHKNGGRERNWETYPAAQTSIPGEKSTSAFYFQVIHPDAISGSGFAQGRDQKGNLKAVLDDILGHDDCAPDRKNDPGPAFPMLQLREHCGFHGLPHADI